MLASFSGVVMGLGVNLESYWIGRVRVLVVAFMVKISCSWT